MANILVRSGNNLSGSKWQNGRLAAKLADFGVTQPLRDKVTGRTLIVKSIRGTPGVVMPEGPTQVGIQLAEEKVSKGKNYA